MGLGMGLESVVVESLVGRRLGSGMGLGLPATSLGALLRLERRHRVIIIFKRQRLLAAG